MNIRATSRFRFRPGADPPTPDRLPTRRLPAATAGLDRPIVLVTLAVGALASALAVLVQGVDRRPELVVGTVLFLALTLLLWRQHISLLAGKIGLLVLGVALTNGTVYYSLYRGLVEGGLESKLIPAGPWVILLTCLAILLFRNRSGEIVALGLWATSATAVVVFLTFNTWPLSERLRVELINQYIFAHVVSLAAALFWSRLWRELVESKSQLATQQVLARTDVLTELGNRRAGEEILARMVDHCQRKGAKLGVILFDLDHFKKINDGFGHATGDRALRRVARIAGSVLRPWDYLCRWGGEEFLVIAQGTDLPTARQVAERLRTVIEKDRSMPVRLTLSAGVASLEPEDDARRLLGRADAALYAAKHSGRNRVSAGAIDAESASVAS